MVRTNVDISAGANIDSDQVVRKVAFRKPSERRDYNIDKYSRDNFQRLDADRKKRDYDQAVRQFRTNQNDDEDSDDYTIERLPPEYDEDMEDFNNDYRPRKPVNNPEDYNFRKSDVEVEVGYQKAEGLEDFESESDSDNDLGDMDMM